MSACAAGGYDTRVDAFADWIDGWVAQADPGFGTSTPPSPSGGTQSPPTSSATPMPPSSAGAGGVGASCVSSDGCTGNEVRGGCAFGDGGGARGGARGDARGDNRSPLSDGALFVALALGVARFRRARRRA